MLVAYDSVLDPTSNHGADCPTSAAYPRFSTVTAIPSARTRATFSATGATVM